MGANDVVERRKFYISGNGLNNPNKIFEINDPLLKRRMFTWGDFLLDKNKKATERTHQAFEKKKKEGDSDIDIIFDSGGFFLYRIVDPYDQWHEFLTLASMYSDFIKEHSELTEFFIALDVPGDAERSVFLYDKMRDDFGVDVVPVYHVPEPLEYLDYYASKSERIAIAFQGAPIEEYYPAISYAFSRYPDHKFHGLAVSVSSNAYREFPFSTCDSATWRFSLYHCPVLLPAGVLCNREKTVYLLGPIIRSTEKAKTLDGGEHEVIIGNVPKKFGSAYRFMNEKDKEIVRRYIRDELGMEVSDIVTEDGMLKPGAQWLAILVFLKSLDKIWNKHIVRRSNDKVAAYQPFLF